LQSSKQNRDIKEKESDNINNNNNNDNNSRKDNGKKFEISPKEVE